MKKKRRVLLVEEEKSERETYEDFIRSGGVFDLDALTRPSEVIDWVGKSHYDLVFLNLDGLKSSRLGMVEKIRQLSPETGVIAYTSNASIPESVEMMRLGVLDYLEPPLSTELLEQSDKRLSSLQPDDEGHDYFASFLRLVNTCQLISGALDKARILEVVRTYFIKELLCDYTAFYSATATGEVARDKTLRSTDDGSGLNEVMAIAIAGRGLFSGLADEHSGFRWLPKSAVSPSLFVVDLNLSPGESIYLVALAPNEPGADFESRVRLLRTQLALAGKNLKQYSGYKTLAYKDDATGLYNARYLDELLDKEVSRSEKLKKEFAVLFIDADKFKAVNDQHGHLVGTKLLNALGGHIKGLVRESDYVFRYGGDEFVVVLSPSSLTRAKQIAERIRQSVEIEAFLESEGLDIRFTVSIGLAMFPRHAKTKDDVLRLADSAMFEAKKKSRNRVEVQEH